MAASEKGLLLDINTITKILLFKVKHIMERVLFILLLTHLITLLSHCVNEFIHVDISCLLSVYQLSCF